MAIPGGYRFKIPFDDVFPQGCFAVNVERAKDYSDGKPRDAVDPINGLPVWSVQVTDPSAKGMNIGQVVRIAAARRPEPLPAIPHTPFQPVVFNGLVAVPYVRDRWVFYTLWAKAMRSALPADQASSAAA